MTEPVVIGGATLYQGDCLDVMRGMEAESVDSIVCDPPYALTANKKGGSGEASLNLNSAAGRSRISTGGGFMGKQWDAALPSVDVWAEALRVAKPGAHLLAFGGTRTFHRLAVAIEDAGWELRDTVMWVYGSGFPKSLDVSKAIDKAAGAEREVVEQRRVKSGGMEHINRSNAATHGYRPDGYQKGENILDITAPATEAAQQWSGWGTALKPAWEPVIVARKPLDGTVAANVLKHGTGALNIDGCRVATDDDLNGGAYAKSGTDRHDGYDNWRFKRKGEAGEFQQPEGRFPANLIHDGSDEVLACFPEQKSGANPSRRGSPKFRNAYGEFEGQEHCKVARGAEAGSAARFFYCAKASRSDRDEGNTHPTVKPTALMAYLCRLVAPPGGIVLDPFMGSGSTGKAAMIEGFRFIGIEREAEYIEIARKRIEAAQRQQTLDISLDA